MAKVGTKAFRYCTSRAGRDVPQDPRCFKPDGVTRLEDYKPKPLDVDDDDYIDIPCWRCKYDRPREAERYLTEGRLLQLASVAPPEYLIVTPDQIISMLDFFASHGGV